MNLNAFRRYLPSTKALESVHTSKACRLLVTLVLQQMTNNNTALVLPLNVSNYWNTKMTSVKALIVRRPGNKFYDRQEKKKARLASDQF